MKFKPFVLPDLPASLNISNKVVVVGVVGKSPLSAKNDKSGPLQGPLGRPVLGPREPGCNIEGYFDTDRNVLFLHLSSLYDTYNLFEAFKEHEKISKKSKKNADRDNITLFLNRSDSVSTDIDDSCDQSNISEGDLNHSAFETKLDFFKMAECGDFLTVYNEIKVNFARSLLFLFNVCHIIVVSQPGSSFDLGYIHLFRALDAIRVKGMSQTSECLRAAGVTSRWYQAGRLCPPRVLFYFQKAPPGVAPDAPVSGGASARVVPVPEIKRLEHCLEDQIYHILRKTRVVTNISANSLFSIPKNEEFVYINTNENIHNDKMAHAVRSLIHSCQNKTNTSDIFGSFGCNPYLIKDESNTTNATRIESGTKTSRNFMQFLQKHVDIAFTTGFEDNVGKYATSPSHFEVPKLKNWINSVTKLYKLYHDQVPEGKTNVVKGLRDLLNVDVRFSENRCAKVLPIAQANYMENLPSHYSKSYHENKMAVALAVFNAHARGPRSVTYAKKLRAECLQHWQQGRQLCEALSLTNHPCVLPKHDSNDPESCDHSSGIMFTSACDCGRTQGRREDPYSVRQANYDFYTLLARECACKNLERASFPVFQPSTHDFRAAQLFNKTTKPSLNDTRPNTPDQELTSQTEDSRSPTRQSTRLSLDNTSDLLGCKTSGSEDKNIGSDGNNEIVIQVSDTDPEQSKDKSLVRQPSTTEYLPGMLHSQSPAGLLPQYPSWSLVCLGPSSLYSHNLGLSESQHPGFISGTNFLLPWDVTVRLEHTQPWPSMLERNRSRKRDKQYVHPVANNTNEFTVKIFVGVEYECPRGHRFMMSSPDKILRASTGLVKDSGNRVTGSDMPLFFDCPCRTNKPQIAQLLRVHVVTPKAPVNVTLDPKVQPGNTNSPIFITGIQCPLKLTQSSYWVLRLPYIYMGDRGVIPSPADRSVNPPQPGTNPHHSIGRLLQGMYGISEMERE